MRQMVVSSSGPIDEQQKKDMERFAAFIARMIRKYGEEVLHSIEEEEARTQEGRDAGVDPGQQEAVESGSGKPGDCG